jgi:Cd2+/Zn2+-exporting ATPase
MSDCSSKGCACAEGPVTFTQDKPILVSKGTVQYRIDNMDCPTEEALIRKKLAAVQGITGLDFNLMQRILTVHHELVNLSPVEAALQDIGMEAQTISANDAAKPSTTEPESKANWWPLALSGMAAMLAELVYWQQGGNHWTVMALALGAILTGGLSTYKKGWIALRHRNLNMNALMSIAVTGAMAIGHWPEAAMVMFLFALAEVIEAKSLDRARNAIRDLMDLAPDTATVLQEDGNWKVVPAQSVPVGAMVRLSPGQRIALDGVLVSGHSSVNQAPITGESLPIDKAEGDPVFAGSINETGSFEYRVTTEASHSTLARIIHAVESAQGSRAPTQRFVDQFAKVYTPSVFVIALLVATIPPLLLGMSWGDWVYKALILLVIACPCALVISTPVTIVSGLAAAARKGILIKGGVYLEQGRRLATLAFDKTGTITHGKPVQTDFVLLGGDAGETRILAASLAARSDHPVSLAIAHAATEAGLKLKSTTEFAAILGRGVRANIDGHTYQLGNHRLIEELGLCSNEIENKLNDLELQGKTVVLLVNQTGVLGIFAVADTVRETSRNAIAELHTLGIKTIMLTGDNAHTAMAIAREVGIDEARGNLLPQDKLKIIGELMAQSNGAKIGMVGDGINDAPALARSDIAFAMGAAGTDTAIETADVALMDDNLEKIPVFVRLSRATAAILTQNIALALSIKAVFLILTFTGQATMWIAVFADMGASLLVVFNGLRLLRR